MAPARAPAPQGEPLTRRWAAAWIAATLAGVALAGPASALALLTPPVTIAGPGSEIGDFGGVAMAPDGTGGIVFVKAVEGVPHVFASRYVENHWSAPLRVDADQPYEASQPRIAAGRGGELLVVWVTQLATVHGKVRYALYSASIGRGASAFGPSLLVDPEVGDGSSAGVDPAVSGTAPNQATVAYRVITYRFDESRLATQLRPGDVLADIRVARLKDDRWSRLGAINVNQELSMRPPSPTNGPQVGAGVDGNAVVAWQEPDQTGAARIYLRRIFGTVPGPILQASPSSWEGAPVTGDVDAFSLAVTPFDQARVAMRVAGNGVQPPRLFLNTLPPGYAIPASALVGVKQVFAPESPATPIGPPGLAAYEKGGTEGMMRLAWAAGPQIREASVDGSGNLQPLAVPAGPPAIPGAEAGTVLDPDGGALVAYPTLDADGQDALAVRQEFADGSLQTGLLSGTQEGPVAELGVAGSGSGDALVGFREGEPGHYEIVAERVSAPPAAFKVKGPKGWTRPRQVKLTWQAASSAAGGLSYAVLLDGRTAKAGLRRRAFRIRPGMLGSGKAEARVLATDALGQQVLSRRLRLLIDGEPPIVRVSASGASVLVRVRDADSGPDPKKTRVDFGDGSSARGGSRFKHAYQRPGRYDVVVHACDEAGNRATRSFEVRVR